MFGNFDTDVIVRSLPYLFYEGMTFTLTLTALATAGGIAFGTVLALMRLSSFSVLSRLAGGYVNLMRSVPLVLVIFWFYFLVPFIGQWITGSSRPIQVGAFASSLVTFTLFEAAYFCEIMRAGIQSIPRGQSDAAAAVGMTYAQSHALHHPAAGVPQHAAGAADADDHPVPGYVARLCALDHRLPRRGLQGRAARRPARRNVSVRGRRLFRHFADGLATRARAGAAHRHCSVKLVIEIDNVSKWYSTFQVLKNCSTRVAKGEVVIVCGPSGSGKSTLIKCVNGLEPFQQGRISVDGIPVGDPKTDLPKLRARVGMVFQHFELFPHLSVMRNLTIAQTKVLGRSEAEADAKALALLERVGLIEQARKFPGNLSGGQQQRVAIARALAMDPIAMLFDEPTSALDPEMINEVLDVMVALAGEGMTMMVVTHEMGFARKVADRVVFMDGGEIIEDADKASFFGSPRSERAQAFLSKILHH